MGAKFKYGWIELPIGGVVPRPGSTVERPTGTWRDFRPIINQEKCVRCYMCWVVCPEPAIRIEDKPYKTSAGREYKVTFTIDYEYCKGCGLCVEECPVKAIDFVPEVR